MTTHEPVRVHVHGASGRMGERLIALARADARFTLIEAVPQAHHGVPRFVDHPRVIIDFTSDAGTRNAIAACMASGAALVVGTTALSPGTLEQLHALARTRAVLIAPNTSLGVAVATHLAREAARLLGPAYDIDIIEWHHTAKRDAPSGTALHIANAIRQVPGAMLAPSRIHAIRAGETIGEHAVQYAGPSERLTIRHEAGSRDLFAHGALRAAAWIGSKPPGLYTMNHVLGLDKDRGG